MHKRLVLAALVLIASALTGSVAQAATGDKTGFCKSGELGQTHENSTGITVKCVTLDDGRNHWVDVTTLGTDEPEETPKPSAPVTGTPSFTG